MSSSTDKVGRPDRDGTFQAEAVRLLGRLKQHILERVKDLSVKTEILDLLEEREASICRLNLSKAEDTPTKIAAIREAVNLAGFIAGVISSRALVSKRVRGSSVYWHHVQAMLSDALDGRAADTVDSGLLATIEVVSGEISEAYKIQWEHGRDHIPDECRIFFDATDLSAAMLGEHLGIPFALVERRNAVTERFDLNTRATPSGIH